MDIKSIRIIRPKDRTSAVLAFTDVALANGVQLCDMRLMRNKEDADSYILRMPTIKSKRGNYLTVFNPTSSEVMKQLTDAVADAYLKTVELNTNEHTVEFEVEAAEPEFSQIYVHRFSQYRQLKALVSCVMDDSIRLNRMTIRLNEDTKSLQLVMPSRIIVKTGWSTSYYRMSKELHMKLYENVMQVYAATTPGQ